MITNTSAAACSSLNDAQEYAKAGDVVASNSCPAGELKFQRPLFGFNEYLDYTLRPALRQGLWWMESTSEPRVTFVLADPFILDETWVLDLSEMEAASLDLHDPSHALVLVMLAMPTGADGWPTANMRAPIVINVENHAASQVVSRVEEHELRMPVDLRRFALVEAEGGS